MKHRRRLFGVVRPFSIFAKLILVFIAAAILINGISLWSLRHFGPEGGPFEPVRRHLVFYLHMLADRMGESPSEATVLDLERTLNLRIRVESDSTPVTIGTDLPSIQSLQPYLKAWPSTDAYIGRQGHKVFFQIRKGTTSYLFFPARELHFGAGGPVLMATILSLTLVLLIGYLFLRRTLNPLRSLDEGIRRVQKGEFDFALPVRGHDELASLMSTFNEMLTKIQAFIGSRDQLLSDVSHELRGPLTRMKLALEFVPDSTAKANLSTDINEMEETIGLILDSSRLSTGQVQMEKSPVVLKNVITETLQKGHFSDKRIDLSQLSSRSVIEGDVRWLKLLFRNLIANALQHGGEGPVTIGLTESAAETRVEIKDKGPGISAAELERVFEPFYRTDKSRQRSSGGIGLGLHLCRKIAETMGAKVFLESQLNVGTTAVVVFSKGKEKAV